MIKNEKLGALETASTAMMSSVSIGGKGGIEASAHTLSMCRVCALLTFVFNDRIS